MEFDKAESRGQDVITICKYLKHSNNSAIEKSEKHRMIWVGRNLKDHLIINPLPQAETLSTRPDCSKPHLNWS